MWDGDNPLALVKPEKAVSEMYVVVPAVTSAKLLITATTDGSDYYALNKPSLTLQAGYFYKSSVKLNSNAEILGAALDEGALVSIAYTVDGVSYTSTFKKVNGEYVEQPTTSDSRALTRASSSVQAQLQAYGSILNVQVIKNNKVVLNLGINSNDGTYNTTFGDGAELKGMTVNDKQVSIKERGDLTIQIINKSDKKVLGEIVYNKASLA